LTTTAQNTPVPAIILFGSPGSGKGTQARLLQNCLKGPHISTGDMLRAHIQSGDAVGHQAEMLIKSGRLVPDEMVNELVQQRLQDSDCQPGIILDGYPRTTNQAEVLLAFMKSFGYRAAVVHLMVDYDKIVARLSGRRQCPVCGTLYSMKTNPPKVAGVCDLDGAKLVTREDDRESVIRERLNQYELQTRPLLDFFRQADVPVLEINAAEASPDQISQEICRSLNSAGLMLGTLGSAANGSR
jgi:adenylate kinase